MGGVVTDVHPRLVELADLVGGHEAGIGIRPVITKKVATMW